MRVSTLAKTILISMGLTGVLLVVLLISLLTGTTVTEVKTLLMQSGQGIDAQRTWTIILSYRLPRTLLAAIAGAGLASAGVVFQGVLKNPLADPYLIGIAAGGSLGAVVSISRCSERDGFSAPPCVRSSGVLRLSAWCMDWPWSDKAEGMSTLSFWQE